MMYMSNEVTTPVAILTIINNRLGLLAITANGYHHHHIAHGLITVVCCFWQEKVQVRSIISPRCPCLSSSRWVK